MVDDKILELEEKIGYEYKDKDLLRKALTHTSYANENNNSKTFHNERIEFLGDAVLEIIVSEYLYFNYNNLSEGEMTKLRAKIVCESTLAYVAKKINLGDYLYLGRGEDATGGRERESILSDAMEAVIGSIFLDSDYNPAKDFIYKYVLSELNQQVIKKLFEDYKTKLQEIAQRHGAVSLKYEIIDEIGPAHNKRFIAQVVLRNQVIGKGKGRNKKNAEQKAAEDAISKMNQWSD